MRYDLNLLKCFDALFNERNVSRAADRIGISQPAMSAVLAKLRDLFNDPLFVRDRYGIIPTEKAIEIHPPLQRALAEIDGLIQSERTFEPKTERRNFELAVNDYFECVILPQLLRLTRQQAPHISIQTTAFTHEIAESGIMSGRTDLAFGRILEPPDNIVVRPAMTESLACLISNKHSTINEQLTLKDYQAFPHVIVRPLTRLKTGIFRVLAEQSIQREVVCSVSHFHAVPALLEKTDYIATLPAGICRLFALNKKLKMLPTPTEFGTFPFHLGWHRRHQKDLAHKWLRDLVLDCCKRVA